MLQSLVQFRQDLLGLQGLSGRLRRNIPYWYQCLCLISRIFLLTLEALRHMSLSLPGRQNRIFPGQMSQNLWHVQDHE